MSQRRQAQENLVKRHSSVSATHSRSPVHVLAAIAAMAATAATAPRTFLPSTFLGEIRQSISCQHKVPRLPTVKQMALFP